MTDRISVRSRNIFDHNLTELKVVMHIRVHLSRTVKDDVLY